MFAGRFTWITSCCALSLLSLVVSLRAQGGGVVVGPERGQLVEDLVIANRILANEGIDPQARPETLSPIQLASLMRATRG